ncbi:MAG: glucose-1-phosphate adenylyltransferase subunit GlgD [Clostridiales bacterium]|nr:glucose-1-phosphate adenylyltransferase subunit GlgD [Clostridiales bacterium]
MMKDVMGIIYTGENDSRLRELTMLRAIAALPVAARFRVIDFQVSSMVNAGIKNIGVIMQKNYHSLMDHLGSGKEWDLHGKNEGLHILPPFLTRENVGVYTGLLDAIRSNTNYLERSKQTTLILSGSDIIYNAHLDEALRFHLDTDASVTLMYTKDPEMKRDELGTYLQLDEAGNVVDMEIQPTHPSYDNVYMKVLIIKRELILNLVDKAVAHGLHDLDRDLLMKMVREGQYKVNACEYKGDCWRIDSVQSFFKFNMDILDPVKMKGIFRDDLPVYTKVRDEMPTYYGDSAEVINSLLADGCQIEGKVENSVLFRGVRIAPDAHVKNCIIMQDGQVHSGAYIENCILDKQSVIKRNAKLIGPDAYPIVIGKNVVI